MKNNPENPATGCAEFTENITGLKFSVLPVFIVLAVAAFSF